MLKKLITKFKLASLRANIRDLDDCVAHANRQIMEIEANKLDAQIQINRNLAAIRKLTVGEHIPDADFIMLRKQAD